MLAASLRLSSVDGRIHFSDMCKLSWGSSVWRRPALLQLRVPIEGNYADREELCLRLLDLIRAPKNY